MNSDIRLWVQDHYLKVWHFYLAGHYNNALCGLKPISGAPLVYYKKPDWPAAKYYDAPVVCQTCIENIQYVPEPIMKAYKEMEKELSKAWG